MTNRGVRLFPMGLVLAVAAVGSAQNAPAVAAEVNAAAAAPAAAPVPAPVYPKRPAEEAPRMPRVTCQGDQITIAANNSTLEQILAMVKGCSGAKIDIPEGASQIRSFEQFGPGPMRKVLDDLLSGTPYNYVIESPEANPQRVDMVLLSMRDKDDNGTISPDIPMTNGRKLWQHMQHFDKPDPSMLNEDGTLKEGDDAAAAQSEAPRTPAQQADANAAANTAPAAEASAAAGEPAAANSGAPAVTNSNPNADPSQVVQDRIAQMQQMFNQRQQMIKQQSQPPSGSPNP